MWHLFPRCFGGFFRDSAFSAVFWSDLQPLLGGCAIYSCIFGSGFAGIPTGMRRLFLWCFGGFSANPAISAICCLTCNPFWGLRQCIKVTCSPFWGCAIYSCLFGVWLALHVLHSVLVDFLGIPPFQSAVFWGGLQPILGVAPSIPVFLGLAWFAGGMEHLFPQCFDGFIVDASISAQPLLGVAPCIPRFWGLVGFTGVHTGMEHLFP